MLGFWCFDINCYLCTQHNNLLLSRGEGKQVEDQSWRLIGPNVLKTKNIRSLIIATLQGVKTQISW